MLWCIPYLLIDKFLPNVYSMVTIGTSRLVVWLGSNDNFNKTWNLIPKDI